ncbi:MAG: IS200/IS605 family transposase [Phycisphaerales bacterium JB039]
MASTLTSILLHIVFSTKNREACIAEAIEPDLHAYIGGICRNNGSALRAAGGTSDHIHLLVSQAKTISTSDLLQQIKGDSSEWIKTRGGEFAGFRWQEGYGAFSIGQSQVGALRRYLAGQKEHHRTRSFQEEFLELLRKYKVEYDERYIWG